MIDRRLLAVIAAVLCIFPLGVVLADDSEALPSADHTVDLGDYSLIMGSADVVIELDDAVRDSAGQSAYMAFARAMADTGNVDSSGLPGWITVVQGDEGNTTWCYGSTLVIDPEYSCESSQFWFIVSGTSSFLFVLDIEVSGEGGGSVTPAETCTYVVHFDTMGGSPIGDLTKVTNDSSLVVSLVDYVPTRDGYDFVGWSSDSSGESVIRDSLTVSGSPGTVSEVTVYAVWDESRLVIPTFWDGLIELFTDPIVLLVLLVLFLAVCYFIRVRTSGGRRR